jgi:hypothetical protein
MFDFHSQLTSTQESNPLFEALRGLSRIEDPKALFNIDTDPIIAGEWPQWPAMAAHASDAASKGV